MHSSPQKARVFLLLGVQIYGMCCSALVWGAMGQYCNWLMGGESICLIVMTWWVGTVGLGDNGVALWPRLAPHGFY